MKTLITSYNYAPENNPRAFRTTALVDEFLRLGHEVTLVIPDYGCDYPYKDNLKIVKAPTGYFLNKNSKNYKSTQLQTLKNNSFLKNRILDFFYIFYLGGRHFEFAFTSAKYLKQLKNEFDMVISIGLPVSVHLGTSLALRKRIKPLIAIADYGDPFSFSIENKYGFIHKHIEKAFLKCYDYIAVPTDAAVSSYLYFKDKSKIKVIPQGYDLSEKIAVNYVKNDKPKFAYAGIFYEKIRNPKIFFDYLVSLKQDFLFTIYTDYSVFDNRKCIEPYIDVLGEKLKIVNSIPRKECIKELSGYDFLINIENASSNQTPSKLIDYYLAGRPVYSFKSSAFSSSVFEEFLKGDYKHNQLNIVDITKFDVRHVAQQFLELYYEYK